MTNETEPTNEGSNSRSLSQWMGELRRRNVFRVAATYLVMSWVAIQVSATLAPELLLPSWTTRAVFFLLLIGFPVAIALGWAFDLTPDGIERTDGSTQSPETLRRRLLFAAGSLAFLGAVGLGIAIWTAGGGAASQEQLDQLVTEAFQEIEEENYVQAYALVSEAESLGADPAVLDSLWAQTSDVVTVTSEPAGAVVAMVGFSQVSGIGPLPSLDTVGTTPIKGLRVPREDHYLYFTLEGYAPKERLTSSTYHHDMAGFSDGAENEFEIHVELVADADQQEGMVHVPGGDYTMVSTDLPPSLSAPLDDFFIDRTEVTNGAYQEFVGAGGYADRRYWTALAEDAGEAFDQTLAGFVDATGLPAPRGWSSQRFPAGQENHPVTGVSWYEAAAYAEFRGKSLPTMYQWEKASRDGAYTPFAGFVLPWGVVNDRDDYPRRANVSGTAVGPVGQYPFGISPHGVYDAAGNVKEWLLNPMASGSGVTGGSWADPVYLLSEIGPQERTYSAPDLGFRLVWLSPNRQRRSPDQGAEPIPTITETPTYQPVDRATFQALRTQFQYDPIEANAEVLERIETPFWTREKVAFDGPGGIRIPAYLYLPKSAAPPFQTMVLIPGADAFFGTPLPSIVEWSVSPIIQSGRAVMTVVMDGMTERPFPPDYESPPVESAAARARIIERATEMSLGVDYLTTRGDIDVERLGYVGISMGAGSGLALAVADERLRVKILIGGGIDERLRPTLPVIDPVNVAAHLPGPTLLVNGRQDEEHPWLTRALPLWNLLPEPKTLALIDGAGHVPVQEYSVPPMLQFLDEHLGEVTRSR